jgi:hypothetical protein
MAGMVDFLGGLRKFNCGCGHFTYKGAGPTPIASLNFIFLDPDLSAQSYGQAYAH